MMMMSIRPIVGACALALVTVLASACATAQAKTAAPEAPALDMPSPPPRTVETVESEPPPPASLPDEPVRHLPPPTTTRRATPRPDTSRPEPPRTDPPVTAPADAPKPAAEPSKPPATLQTTPAEVEGKEEQQIRGLLGRATSDLSRIDYRRLNTDGRTQYDTAKRFVTQAEDALRKKNLVLARSVADKAAALAAQLSGK